MAAKSSPKKPSPDKLALDTRIMATFALMEIVNTDAENISEADFEEIFDKIKNMQKIADELTDEDVFNAVVNNNLESIKSTDDIRNKIGRSKVLNIYKQLGYFGLGKGETQEHRQSSAQILATMMYEARVTNADEIAEKIVMGELTEEDAKKLHQQLTNGERLLKENEEENSKEKKRSSGYDILKKRLIRDFKTYESQSVKNPVIEWIREDIEEYTFDKDQKLELDYSITTEQKPFREALRGKFNKNPKIDFFKFYGRILADGRNIAQNPSMSPSYPQFCQTLQSLAGDKDLGGVIDEALGISTKGMQPNQAESARQKAYIEKAKELYFKTIAGIICQKYEYIKRTNQDCDFGIYLQTINNKYIKGLTEGKNDLAVLAFQDPQKKTKKLSYAEELKMIKELRDETAEQQIISIHHGEITIGAASDVCERIVPCLDMHKKIEKSSEIVNHLSNFVYVIGQDVHQSMEPNGIIKIGSKPKGMIMATNVDARILKAVAHQLPPYINEGFKKYLKLKDGDTVKRVCGYMKLPESPQLEAFRTIVSMKSPHVPALQKFERYERGM